MIQNPPSSFVEAAHAASSRALPFGDTADFEDASRGLIATLQPGLITNAAGATVWDADAYGFLEGPAPTSVNPSLWRQSQLVAKQGLFEVVEGIYQVPGLDLSNMTLVEGTRASSSSTR
jgi:alkyl sulfatase BDS1-like metallo-beta-lactamase superfamily hydrolase